MVKAKTSTKKTGTRSAGGTRGRAQSAVDKALKNWGKTDEAESLDSENNENVPDGRYLATIECFKLDEFAGKPIARLSFKIVSPVEVKGKDEDFDAKIEATSEIVHSRYGLDNPKGQGFLKRDLRVRFGFSAEDVNAIDGQEALGSMLEEIQSAGNTCQISVKTNADDWQNVYVEKELDDASDRIDDDDDGEEPRIDEEEEEGEALEDLESADLKKIAKEEGVDLGKSRTKKVIIEKIEAARAAGDAGEESEEEEEEEEEETEESEPEDSEEDEEELEVGSKVVTVWKGDEVEGVVREISDDETKCKIYIPSIKKRINQAIEKVELVIG